MFRPRTPGSWIRRRSVKPYPLSFLVVAVLAACLQSCCLQEEYYTAPPPLDEEGVDVLESGIEESPSEEASAVEYAIQKVVIVPSTVHAEVGATFKLYARGRTPSGKWVITGLPAASWSAGGHLQFTSGNPTIVTVGDPWSGAEATAAAPEVRKEIDDVTVTVDGVTSQPATVFISRPLTAAGNTHDQVRLAWAPDKSPSALILDAKIGGNHEQDMLHAVVARAYLDENLEDGTEPGYPQFAALSEQYAAVYESSVLLAASSTAGTPLLWTPSKGDVVDRSGAKPPRDDFPVRFWKGAHRGTNSAGNDVVVARIGLDRGEAQHVFDRSLAGIEIQDNPILRAGSVADETFLDRFCNASQQAEDSLKAFLQAGLDATDPAQQLAFGNGEVYVALVDKYQRRRNDGTWETRIAKACSWQGRDYAVVVMDFDNLNPTLLAHELGHTLALNEKYVSPFHAFTSQGFTCSNTMWAGYDTDCPDPQYQFSLGQAYRMSLDDASLLFRRTGVGPGVDCQFNGLITKECPILTLDFPTTGY